MLDPSPDAPISNLDVVFCIVPSPLPELVSVWLTPSIYIAIVPLPSDVATTWCQTFAVKLSPVVTFQIYVESSSNTSQLNSSDSELPVCNKKHLSLVWSLQTNALSVAAVVTYTQQAIEIAPVPISISPIST